MHKKPADKFVHARKNNHFVVFKIGGNNVAVGIHVRAGKPDGSVPRACNFVDGAAVTVQGQHFIRVRRDKIPSVRTQCFRTGKNAFFGEIVDIISRGIVYGNGSRRSVGDKHALVGNGNARRRRKFAERKQSFTFGAENAHATVAVIAYVYVARSVLRQKLRADKLSCAPALRAEVFYKPSARIKLADTVAGVFGNKEVSVRLAQYIYGAVKSV